MYESVQHSDIHCAYNTDNGQEDEELTHKMREASAAVRAEAVKENIDLRIAAFVLGIRRVGKAATSRTYVSEEINL